MASITSDKNPRIQQILKLREKSRERREQGLFVIEGIREVTLALKGGIHLAEIFYCAAFIQPTYLEELKKKTQKVDWIEIGKSVYEKIALRDSTEGIIAVAKIQNLKLEQIKLPENPLLLIVESVEKPGNLGALLRTADAAVLSAVLVCDPNVDLYNPNVIRSSLGCVFTQSECDSLKFGMRVYTAGCDMRITRGNSVAEKKSHQNIRGNTGRGIFIFENRF